MNCLPNQRSERANHKHPLDAPANWACARIIMSNAWQDPEVPARSATIKPTQHYGKTSQDS
jgi:hypothetical protein